MDWETWLRAAAKRPSDHEDAKREATEKQIRDALSSYEPLKGRPYRVYAKGSYTNNTNVRLNFDVDIAVEYRGFFYYDLCFGAQGHATEELDIVDSTDSYTRDQFKSDVKAALVSAFGSAAIETGRIAYRIRQKKTTLPADVVPCWEYRRYDSLTTWHQGACVFPTGGSRTPNYPSQQLSNGILKNDATSRRYKRMVRALKRMQTNLVERGVLTDEIASYHVECLVYNVPNASFEHSTYSADMRAVLASLFNETLLDGGWSDWEEVNGLKYLFRGSGGPTRAQAHALADVAWDKFGFT